MSRMGDLLNKAADAMDDGTDPFCTAFLDEHQVTFDECMDMAGFLAAGARVMAWASNDTKAFGAAMAGAANGLAHKAWMDAMDRWDAAKVRES